MTRRTAYLFVPAYAVFAIGILCAHRDGWGQGAGSAAAPADVPTKRDVLRGTEPHRTDPSDSDAGRDQGRGAGPAWREGRDFQRQLQLPVGIAWSETPLLQGLNRLAESQGVAIWLDRRVDPNRLMDLSTSGVSLEVALRQVAAKLNLGVGFVGNVVYLGPKPVAIQLATIAALKREATAKFGADARVAWQRKIAFRWDPLTSPAELLDRLTRELRFNGGEVRVVELERLPHDLWAGGNFPPLSPTDRLTLLLAGFDLSFDLARDGTAIRLAPLPESAALSRTFSPSNALRAEQQLAREFPGVKLERRGNRLTATGHFEDLELIGRLLRGETISAPVVEGAEVRFDLKVDNTEVGAILGALKKQRNLTVTVDPAVRDKLGTLVSFNVQQVTLAELLDVALKPAGITFRLDGTTLQLLPGD